MRRKIILAVFLFGSFFIFNFVLAATSTVVINEIGAYPSSTHEWVEIFNASDNLIDLSNWKFWENNTNHGLKIVSTSDMFLSSKDYAIIAQNRDVFLQDYPSFSGKVFGSSWVNLSESGEEIGLKSSDGNFVEKFIYLPAVSFSLERKDPFLLDYSSNNWQENNSSNTAGMQNFNYFVDETVSSSSILIDTSINTTTNTTTNFSTSSDVTLDSLVTSSTTSTIELSTTSPDWSLVKLNEIVSDPVSGNEMVEIFNNSSTTIDLNGGEICDTTGSECKILSGVVLGHDWLVADLFTDRYLNNTGDGVVLKDSQNNIIDMVAYGTSTLPSPDKSQSLIRKED